MRLFQSGGRARQPGGGAAGSPARFARARGFFLALDRPVGPARGQGVSIPGRFSLEYQRK